MTTGPDLFALPEVEAMLREELGLVPAHAARQPGGRALLVQPSAGSLAIPVDARHLTVRRLAVAGDLLRGDVLCAPHALPWEDESFQLVVVQHVGDALPAESGLADELARVMAPGSLMLWFGFNPWSPWLAWLHWRGRAAAPQTVHADTLRRRLSRLQLATMQVGYLGGCWPHREDTEARPKGGFLAPLHGAYVITARKQRAVLTPLRPRLARKSVALGSRLAGTPTHRACA